MTRSVEVTAPMSSFGGSLCYSWIGALLLILIAGSNLVAQQLGPFDGRPPEVDAKALTDRETDAVNEMVARLAQALWSLDSASVSSLMENVAVPRDERDAVARLGCGTWADILASLQERSDVAPSRSGSGLLLEVSGRSIDRDAGTATVVGALVVYTRARLRYAPVEITLQLSGGKVSIQGASGALVGLCGLQRNLP